MQQAIVVGAGIGGLSAALGLKRAGWQVQVLERHPQAAELGFALLLAPNAMFALGELGVLEAVRSAGFNHAYGEMRRPDGTVLRRLDAAPVERALGQPTMVALRPVLHGALLDAVGRENVRLGAKCVDVEVRDGSAAVVLEGGGKLSARVVIGADGVGSIVRRTLHPDEVPARRSGLLALRGVAEGVAHHLGTATGAQYFGKGFEAGVARANGTAVYWFVSIPGEPEEPRALLERVASRFHRSFRDIVLATKPEALRLDELLVRDRLPWWGRGAVTLLGDAAHPMLPHAGQGAAQAIEDGLALSRALSGAAEPIVALRCYERVRMARTHKIVALARSNARIGALSNPLAIWARDAAIRLMPERAIVQRLIDVGRPPIDELSA